MPCSNGPEQQPGAGATPPPAERAEGLGRLATELRRRQDDLALLATLEMGKPLAESRAEVEKCARTCDWYADHAPALLEPETVVAEALVAHVLAQPLGVLLAIMPWNFPYWQVVRALAPALAAGNVAVLKHAPSTTGCALALADATNAAGLPSGALSVMVVNAEHTVEVIDPVIRDHRVAAVTLTGSTRAGRSVAAVAGEALKKTVLELGGSDAFVVLADADLDAAAGWGARSRFQNTGQSCIAAKRIVVEESIADQFTEKLIDQIGSLRLGNPTEDDVTVGPLAREDLRDAVERQIRESVAQGARILVGGRVPNRPGFFYEPTVLDHVQPGMAVLEEEVFGPAVPILRAAGCRGGARPRQWQRLRPRQCGVDLGSRPGGSIRVSTRCRAHGGERYDRVRPPFALRRCQGLGLWPRAVPSRLVRVRQLPHGRREPPRRTA